MLKNLCNVIYSSYKYLLSLHSLETGAMILSKTCILMAGRDSTNEKVKYLKSLFFSLVTLQTSFQCIKFFSFYFSEWAGCLLLIPPNASSCLPRMLTPLENDDKLPWLLASCWF